MTDGVSEVENLPNAAFVLIPGNNARFNLYATDDDIGQRVTRCTPPVKNPGDSADHGIKVTPIRNRAMLKRLGKSCSQFSKWKRIKELRVYQNSCRRVESPHQVLSRLGVHPSFSAYRGVDHCQQSGRHVDYRDAPHVGRGHESREIAN